MKAIYQGRLYWAIDTEGDEIKLESIEDASVGVIKVPLSDPTLVIDPTDDQIEEARNGEIS